MKKSIKSALMQAGATLAVSVVAVALRKAGVIDKDASTRIAMMMIGLVIAWQSNATPKAAPLASARRRALDRVSGWAFVLSGLGYTAIWAFAPMASAPFLSMVPIATAGLTVLAYCLSTRDRSAKVTD